MKNFEILFTLFSKSYRICNFYEYFRNNGFSKSLDRKDCFCFRVFVVAPSNELIQGYVSFWNSIFLLHKFQVPYFYSSSLRKRPIVRKKEKNWNSDRSKNTCTTFKHFYWLSEQKHIFIDVRIENIILSR